MTYPANMPFRQAVMFGYVKPWQSREYLNWVKHQPCCLCGQPADDPHHIHMPGKGMGTKHPDFAVIPLCRPCHDEAHRKGWDGANVSQVELAFWVLGQAITEGVFKCQK